MAIFKKKTKREINEDDSLIVKLWFNERSHAAIVLGLYFVFFATIIIVISATSSSSNIKNSVTGENIADVFKNVKPDDTTYNFVISSQNKTYYFSGETKDDAIYGTLLHNGESINIRIYEEKCAVGDYVDGEFVPKYTLCPEIIDYKYFDYMNIYNLIKNVKGRHYSQNGYYVFELDDKSVIKIYYTNKKINKIIVNNDISYELTFDEKEIDTDKTEE